MAMKLFFMRVQLPENVHNIPHRTMGQLTSAPRARPVLLYGQNNLWNQSSNKLKLSPPNYPADRSTYSQWNWWNKQNDVPSGNRSIGILRKKIQLSKAHENRIGRTTFPFKRSKEEMALEKISIDVEDELEGIDEDDPIKEAIRVIDDEIKEMQKEILKMDKNPEWILYDREVEHELRKLDKKFLASKSPITAERIQEITREREETVNRVLKRHTELHRVKDHMQAQEREREREKEKEKEKEKERVKRPSRIQAKNSDNDDLD